MIEVPAVLTDRALKQTARRGGTYAMVPLPWLDEWAQYVAQHGAEFDHTQHCGVKGHGWNLEHADINDDGDVMLCLLAPEHEGRCGWERERVMAVTPVA